MKIVAITGRIGAGKSTVTNIFKSLGAEVISADEISHRIMKKGTGAYEEVIKAFGSEIISYDQEIDRQALSKIVFNNKEKLGILNGITHKYIYREISRLIVLSSHELVCVEIPLLFGSECPIAIDYSVAVIADEDIKINRVINRDGCTKEDVLKRLEKQVCDEDLKVFADFVIENNSDTDSLVNQVKDVYDKVIKD